MAEIRNRVEIPESLAPDFLATGASPFPAMSDMLTGYGLRMATEMSQMRLSYPRTELWTVAKNNGDSTVNVERPGGLKKDRVQVITRDWKYLLKGATVVVSYYDHDPTRPYIKGWGPYLAQAITLIWGAFSADSGRSLRLSYNPPQKFSSLSNLTETTSQLRRIIRTSGTLVFATTGGPNAGAKTGSNGKRILEGGAGHTPYADNPGAILVYDVSGTSAPTRIQLTGSQDVADMVYDQVDKALYVSIWENRDPAYPGLCNGFVVDDTDPTDNWIGQSRLQKYDDSYKLVWDVAIDKTLRADFCPSLHVGSDGILTVLCFGNSDYSNFGQYLRQWVLAVKTNNGSTVNGFPVELAYADPDTRPSTSAAIATGYAGNVQTTGGPIGTSGAFVQIERSWGLLRGTYNLSWPTATLPLAHTAATDLDNHNGTAASSFPTCEPLCPLMPHPCPDFNQTNGQLPDAVSRSLQARLENSGNYVALTARWNWLVDEQSGVQVPGNWMGNQLAAFALKDGTSLWNIHGTKGLLPTFSTTAGDDQANTVQHWMPLGFATRGGKRVLLTLRESSTYRTLTRQFYNKTGSTGYISGIVPSSIASSIPNVGTCRGPVWGSSNTPTIAVGGTPPESVLATPAGPYTLPAAPALGDITAEGITWRDGFWSAGPDPDDTVAREIVRQTGLFFDTVYAGAGSGSSPTTTRTKTYLQDNTLELALYDALTGTLVSAAPLNTDKVTSQVRVPVGSGSPQVLINATQTTRDGTQPDFWTLLNIDYYDSIQDAYITKDHKALTDLWIGLILVTGEMGHYYTDGGGIHPDPSDPGTYRKYVTDFVPWSYHHTLLDSHGARGTTSSPLATGGIGYQANTDLVEGIYMTTPQVLNSRRFCGEVNSPLRPGALSYPVVGTDTPGYNNNPGEQYVFVYGVQWNTALITSTRQAPVGFNPLKCAFLDDEKTVIFGPSTYLNQQWGTQIQPTVFEITHQSDQRSIWAFRDEGEDDPNVSSFSGFSAMTNLPYSSYTADQQEIRRVSVPPVRRVVASQAASHLTTSAETPYSVTPTAVSVPGWAGNSVVWPTPGTANHTMAAYDLTDLSKPLWVKPWLDSSNQPVDDGPKSQLVLEGNNVYCLRQAIGGKVTDPANTAFKIHDPAGAVLYVASWATADGKFNGESQVPNWANWNATLSTRNVANNPTKSNPHPQDKAEPSTGEIPVWTAEGKFLLFSALSPPPATPTGTGNLVVLGDA